MIDHAAHLSAAARAFEESAIRRIGALGARVPDLISFAPGYPAVSTFPWDDLRAITTELIERRDGNVLQYGATRGYRPLIEQVVGLLSERGVQTSADEIIITTGSQQGLDLSGRVLADPGDVAFVELPTYSGAIAAFRNLGVSLVGVAQDEDGISIQALRDEMDAVRDRGRRARFHLRHTQLPEPGRPADVRAPAARAAGAGRRTRPADPRRRSVRQPLLRGPHDRRGDASDQGR